MPFVALRNHLKVCRQFGRIVRSVGLQGACSAAELGTAMGPFILTKSDSEVSMTVRSFNRDQTS